MLGAEVKLSSPVGQPLAPPSAFDFGGVTRNLALAGTGLKGPKATSTGTTIVGAVFKDGVVIGADSRATEGNIIADKNCNKLHKLTDSIYAAGAGTAADLDQVTRMLAGQLQLQELHTGRKARVISALRHAKQYLFRYQGHVGAYLLIGGVDAMGPELYEVAAHGSTTQGAYAADGSGSLNAIAVLESGWRKDMPKQDCVDLVVKGLEAGMHGDLASGNSLRYAVITKDSTEIFANIQPSFTKSAQRSGLKIAPGSTKVLNETTTKLLKAKVKAKAVEVVESMEVS